MTQQKPRGPLSRVLLVTSLGLAVPAVVTTYLGLKPTAASLPSMATSSAAPTHRGPLDLQPIDTSVGSELPVSDRSESTRRTNASERPSMTAPETRGSSDQKSARRDFVTWRKGPRPRSPYYQENVPTELPDIAPAPPRELPPDGPSTSSFSDELTSDEEVIVIETNEVVQVFESTEPPGEVTYDGETEIEVDPSPPLDFGF